MLLIDLAAVPRLATDFVFAWMSYLTHWFPYPKNGSNTFADIDEIFRRKEILKGKVVLIP